MQTKETCSLRREPFDDKSAQDRRQVAARPQWDLCRCAENKPPMRLLQVRNGECQASRRISEENYGPLGTLRRSCELRREGRRWPAPGESAYQTSRRSWRRL